MAQLKVQLGNGKSKATMTDGQLDRMVEALASQFGWKTGDGNKGTFVAVKVLANMIGDAKFKRIRDGQGTAVEAVQAQEEADLGVGEEPDREGDVAQRAVSHRDASIDEPSGLEIDGVPVRSSRS